MKTIAIPTLGWSGDDCDAFEQYVNDVAEDFYANLSISHTTDYYFEIDLEDDDTAVEWIITHATGMVL
jgi:hypothetical protein